jgi:DNA-binding SARP family transcriptional activator
VTPEFRILGPLEVGLGRGREARLPAGNARRLLCLLLVRRGEVVEHEAIVDALWPDRPPRNARNAVQVVVSRVRAAVGADAVFAASSGYGIAAAAQAIDADRFEALLARGRAELAAENPLEAAATLRAALALWRGPALADVRSEPFAHPEIARLEAMRLACTAERIAAALAAGEDSPLGEIEGLAVQHPLDERVRELQMLALYRAGRQTDALAVYRDARRALLRELGLEPGPALRRLELQILQHAVPAPERPSGVPAGADGTRRPVTCVFARLVSDGAEEIDPELLAARVSAYHAAADAACRRHGGTVRELRSDGAAMVFGIPAAHEDDPLRAVRTALELHAETAVLGDGLGSAAGVCTGVVVAATAAPGAPLIGRAVTAAEALAQGHREVRLAASTHTLLGHAVHGAALGDGSFRVAGLAADASAIERRLDRPMVGRAAEMAVIRAGHARAAAEEAWVRVTVIGEPGVGKSRLAEELRGAGPAGARVLVGRCPPYGEGTTYRPLRDIVLQICAGRSIAQTAAALGVEAAIVERAAASVGLVSGTVGEEAPWAFRQVLRAVSRDAPVVAVLDDVHWAEPGLLDLLDDVTRHPAADAGLLVCLGRPEIAESRPEWAVASDRCVVLELEPLSDAESRRLLAAAGGAGLDADARRRIVRTAAGNPLFLEQLATYVRERRPDGDLPPAISALLAARLDILESVERSVLCEGAIQSDGFTAASLHAVSGGGTALATIEQACASLVRRRFLSADTVFRFRHALIRDAAYGSLAKATRARLHERYATWLSRLDDAPPDTEARVGYQLEAAYECALAIRAPAASELAVRARAALAAAAKSAHRSGDLRGEIGLLERAARFRDGPPLARAQLLPALAAALFAAGSFDRATAVAEEAVQVGRQLDPVIHARALVERERLLIYQQQATVDVRASLGVADRALRTLTRLGDDLGAARAHYLRCELVWMGGDPEAGYASAARMHECARRAGSGFEASAAIGFMAWALVQGQTRVDAALEGCRELRALGAGDRVAALEIDGFRAVLLAMAGDTAAARREMAGSRAGLDELGLRQACAYMALFDGQLEMLAGDRAAAERAVRDAARVTAETGDRWFESTVRVDLALVLLSGKVGSQAAAAVRAIDAVPAPADAEWVVKRHRARALLAAGRGELALATREARAAAGAADGTNLLVFRADAHRTLAEVLALCGDATGAAEETEAALRLCEAKQNTAAAAALAR